MQPYEVWCHNCNVTFPGGTRTCLHCGGRTRPERPQKSMRGGSEAQRFAPAFRIGGDALDDSSEQAAWPSFDGLPGPSAEEEEPVRRSVLRAGMTALWMVLLIAGYAWRACSQ